MGIFSACMLFVALILVYLAITEIFAVLFRFTGLPAEKARFQVISLLTGCGFTTKESEIILSSHQRRKLARITMLFGYTFTVTIVSAVVNIFLSLKQSEIQSLLWGLPIPAAILAAFLLLRRFEPVRRWINRTVERIAGRILFRDGGNRMLLLEYVGRNVIAQVDLLEIPADLKNVPLRESGLREVHGILVMLLERSGGEAVLTDPETIFQKGDRLVVFGKYDRIRTVFHTEGRKLAPLSK